MPSEPVAAGTYDSDSQLLYVIDADSEPGRDRRWARRQRASLRTTVSTLITPATRRTTLAAR